MSNSSLEFLKTIFAGLQAVAVVFTAGWAYWRFKQEAPLDHRIEFDVDCEFWKPGEGIACLASVTVKATNKGNVENHFELLGFEIKGIATEKLNDWPTYQGTVHFEEVLRMDNVVPPEEEWFFVRPGVTQTFNYAVQIPANIRYVKILAFFHYTKDGYKHTAQKIYEVKETL